MGTKGGDRVGLQLFDSHKQGLVDEALLALSLEAPDDAVMLRRLRVRLTGINDMLEASPSLRIDRQLALGTRNQSTLIDHLTEIDGLSGDLELPFKATMSRTLLLAKIQFLRGVVKAAAVLQRAGHEFEELIHELREELAREIYTLMAEELLLALLRKPNVQYATKVRAADQLITIWDDAQLEIHDFCPLLEAAWHARNRISATVGSMLGASEYFRLVAEDCPPQFLDFFARGEVSMQEGQAFEEFLFNFTYEELQHLGAAMRRQGRKAIDTEWAGDILGRRIEQLDHSGEIDPLALYRSYCRRQTAADFRIMAGGEGPRRTAEAYMMIYLLRTAPAEIQVDPAATQTAEPAADSAQSR
jgi:hypothetical protein